MNNTAVRRYAGLVGALALTALIIATQIYVGARLRGDRVSFAAALVMQLCHWESWALAGPLVWRLERRWPLVPPRRRQALRRHIATAPLVAVAVLSLNLAAYHALVRVPALSPWFARMDRSLLSTAVFYVIAYFHLELVLYAGIVAVAHAAHTTALLRARETDALRLEAELTGARLTALRMQLQPHFLFNTLHTIGSLVLQRQNDRAVQILAELGELLRGTLAHRDIDATTVRDEMASLQRYLRIEEVRFGDRLRTELDVDPGAAAALMPPFLLQPLVENAFRHGISRRTDESLLRIAAKVDRGSLRITIYNDGPPLADAFSVEAVGGYGLKNVMERLRARKPAGCLELRNEATGVCATLVLPLPDRDGTAPGQ